MRKRGDRSRVLSKRWNSRRLEHDRENSTPRGAISRGPQNWRIASVLSFGSEWNECHEASYLLSNHRLHRTNSEMNFSKLLCIPISYRRSQSGTRREASPIRGRGEVNLAAPRPAESTPDLRIGTSTLPASGPRGRKLHQEM